MTVTLVRDEQGSPLLPCHRLGVYLAGRRVGTVMQNAHGGTWRVFDAGMGVHDDDPLRTFTTAEDAADRLLDLRRASSATAVVDGLTGAERTVLDLESTGLASDGRKQQAIRTALGITETRYYQVLNRLLDRPEALEYAPVTVSRLRRHREQRAARRSMLRAV